jgi:hypothetical protein
MANLRLSCSAARSLVFAIAALSFTACAPAESGGGAGGSGGSGGPSSGSAGGGGSATPGSGGGSGATATGGSTAGTSGALGIGGSAGSSGNGGIAGSSGAAGTAGSAGTAGAAGTAGSAGSTGTAGRGGTMGTAGTSAAGTTGAAGRGGTTGTGGTTGAAGRGGTTGTAGSTGAAGAGVCQRGQVAGNEVLIIGDSYFPAAGSAIPNELRRLAGGAAYRDVSVGGTKMAAIAASYTRNRTPPPKVVIMDGGGNDILQNPGCAPGCAQHMQAVTDARNLFRTMATDGSVTHIVFIFYYDMPALKAGLDWMRPKMAAECQMSPVPCFFADNQPLFAGQDASTYTTDGIHPTAAAGRTIAKQAWDIMVNNCIAQ